MCEHVCGQMHVCANGVLGDPRLLCRRCTDRMMSVLCVHDALTSHNAVSVVPVNRLKTAGRGTAGALLGSAGAVSCQSHI